MLFTFLWLIFRLCTKWCKQTMETRVKGLRLQPSHHEHQLLAVVHWKWQASKSNSKFQLYAMPVYSFCPSFHVEISSRTSGVWTKNAWLSWNFSIIVVAAAILGGNFVASAFLVYLEHPPVCIRASWAFRSWKEVRFKSHTISNSWRMSAAGSSKWPLSILGNRLRSDRFGYFQSSFSLSLSSVREHTLK